MSTMPGRLGTLRARDIMSTDVLTLGEAAPISMAVQLLKENRHSGAPVVDSHGRLVGTFSLRNLTGVKRTNAEPDPREAESNLDSAVISAEAFESLLKTSIADDKVCERMTENAPSVSENASLIDVTRLMYDFHTHRVPVTNVHSELVGIITTMDILAALVHTADEIAGE